MVKLHAVITGVGGYVPNYLLTNEEISAYVDTSDEWIQQRIGIKERRILKPEEGIGVSYLAQKAIEDLQSKQPFNPLEIEAIIFATSTPDYILPGAASLVAFKTGMNNAFGFDLSAACSGFIYALETANNFILSGRYKKVIVIAGDVLSTVTDTMDRNTCPIFSDACGVVLVEAKESKEGIIDAVLHVDGDSVENLHMLGGGSVNPASHETVDKRMHYIWQNGKVVFKKAVTSMADACNEIIQRNNITKDDVKWIVPHQANLRIIEAVASRLDVPISKVMVNIEKYGNSSAGTIPLCLWNWEKIMRKGDNVILTAFGAGYTWGAIYLKWGYNA